MKGEQIFSTNSGFEVNPYTMAVIGEKINQETMAYSRILEVENEFIIKMKSTSIIDRSCRYFGSSLKGRLEGTRELTGISYKPPVAVDPTNEIYMFPTSSPYKDTCAWIAHSYILNYHSVAAEKTLITFTNHQSIILNVSKGSFENQVNKTAQFRFILSNRLIFPKHQPKKIYAKELDLV